MYPEQTQILIIDSDQTRRRASERVLSEAGFSVTAVAEGLSAVRASRAGRFALALAAVDLPGALDGLTTLRHLRARQPWLRALFTGAIAERPRRLDWLNDDFIAAPAHPRDLLGCVFELLERARSTAADPRDFSRAG